MDVGVGILFLAVLCAEISVISGLCGRHIYFRYNTTSGHIVDNTIEQLDLENMGIAVRILSVNVLELEITVGYFTFPPVNIMCM